MFSVSVLQPVVFSDILMYSEMGKKQSDWGLGQFFCDSHHTSDVSPFVLSYLQCFTVVCHKAPFLAQFSYMLPLGLMIFRHKPLLIYKISPCPALINCLSVIKKMAEKTGIILSAPPSLVPKVVDHLWSVETHIKPCLLGITTLDSGSVNLICSRSFPMKNIAEHRCMLSQVEVEILIHTFISPCLD